MGLNPPFKVVNRWHVVEVLSRENSRPMTFTEAKNKVELDMMPAWQDAVIKDYLLSARQDYPVELMGDYAPGNGAYDPCVSDRGRYVPIEPTISSIGRVRAFEDIAALLFDPARDASPDDFVEARRIYQEDEGLDSRIVRRYDPHFVVPDGTDCTMPGVPAAFAEYCVGPARLQPVALDALNAGIIGDAPRMNAGRVEGAPDLMLLWLRTDSDAHHRTFGLFTGHEQAQVHGFEGPEGVDDAHRYLVAAR